MHSPFRSGKLCFLCDALLCRSLGNKRNPVPISYHNPGSSNAFVYIGNRKENLIFQQKMVKGDVVFIPAGLWHNIVNTDRYPLKLSVIYAPPNHPKGTVHRTKMDATMEGV